MTSDAIQAELIEATLWALDRLLRGEYKEARDTSGNIDSMVLDRDFAAGGTHPSVARSSTAPRRYLQELRLLLPNISRRSATLRSVSESGECPEFVRRFLREAAKCVVYGQFLSSVFLCRSALAEILVVGLRKRGFESDLAAIKEEGLKGIFRLARDKGLLDSARYRQAEEIRVLANQAIHGKESPTEEECIRIFNVTAGIAKDFFA